MNKKKHSFVVETTNQLKSLDADYANLAPDEHEWTMWLDLETYVPKEVTKLRLHPVKSDYDYEQMFYLRSEIEEAFNITNPNEIKNLVNKIRKMANHFHGRWYMAQLDNLFIGEIGLVPFAYANTTVGSIQDVDILPSFQGNGFAADMLNLICIQALMSGMTAVCLTAKSDEWPKDWYLKYGFEKVGEVIP